MPPLFLLLGGLLCQKGLKQARITTSCERGALDIKKEQYSSRLLNNFGKGRCQVAVEKATGVLIRSALHASSGVRRQNAVLSPKLWPRQKLDIDLCGCRVKLSGLAHGIKYLPLWFGWLSPLTLTYASISLYARRKSLVTELGYTKRGSRRNVKKKGCGAQPLCVAAVLSGYRNKAEHALLFQKKRSISGNSLRGHSLA